MTDKPECSYCGTTEGLGKVHDGCWGVSPEYVCVDCFDGGDEGPCFDDLPVAGERDPDTWREEREEAKRDRESDR
jgi:hypothetical protein